MIISSGRITPTFGSLLLNCCRKSSRSSIEPEHFFLVLLDSDDGVLAKACRRVAPTVSLNGLRRNLFETAKNNQVEIPPYTDWNEALLSTRSRQVLDLASADPDWNDESAERLLARFALQRLLERVTRVLRASGVEPDSLHQILSAATPSMLRPVLEAEGNLVLEGMNPAARSVVKNLQSEGSSLGQSRISTPLLLYALVALEGGAVDRALRLMGAVPRELRESLIVHLRGMSKGSHNDDLRLHRDSMQPVVQQAFQRAAALADERGYDFIGDEDLASALLLEDAHFTRGFLDSRQVDVTRLSTLLRSPRPDALPAETADAETRQRAPLPEVLAHLRARIIRQDHVIDALVPFLKRLWFGYRRKARPLAVLLFLGYSGTGKTQLAKELARAVYGSVDELLYFEMGQFATEHSKNIFVGAPQGYEGYGEGLLTNGLHDKPESVVLFDEVEKAHPSVFDVLLRFLDEGLISDPAGFVRDGRKCLIILTSNAKIDQLESLIRIQMNAMACGRDEQDAARAQIRKILVDQGLFRREFVNRIDELLLFNALDEQAYRQILQLELEDEQRRLWENKRLRIEFTPDVIELLLRDCLARSGEGARVCGKVISTTVISAVIDFFVDDANRAVKAARVTVGPRGEVVILPLEGAT